MRHILRTLRALTAGAVALLLFPLALATVCRAESQVDTAHPWVSLNVREDSYKGFDKGRTIKGSVPALDLKDVPFRVYYISPQGDFATWRATRQSSGFDIRSFEIRLRPAQPVKGLRPGMSVLFDWPQ